MANPDLLDNGTVQLAVLVQAQLASGNSDFTVPSGHAWTVRSFTIANVSGGAVTVTGSAGPNTGTLRTFLPAEAIAAGEVLVLDPAMLAHLPEAAVLRLNASAGTAVDVLITGVDAS